MPEARAAYLALGANLGDKAATLAQATARLDAVPGIRVVARSSLYRTPPWGDTDQDWFLNAALGLSTTLTPHALLDACLAVETALGRVRTRRWGPRAIDVDVLAYEGVALDDARLTLPHPLMRERAFVLVPLAEIAPDLAIGGMTVSEALARLDASGIEHLGAMPLVPPLSRMGEREERGPISQRRDEQPARQRGEAHQGDEVAPALVGVAQAEPGDGDGGEEDEEAEDLHGTGPGERTTP